MKSVGPSNVFTCPSQQACGPQAYLVGTVLFNNCRNYLHRSLFFVFHEFWDVLTLKYALQPIINSTLMVKHRQKCSYWKHLIFTKRVASNWLLLCAFTKLSVDLLRSDGIFSWFSVSETLYWEILIFDENAVQMTAFLLLTFLTGLLMFEPSVNMFDYYPILSSYLLILDHWIRPPLALTRYRSPILRGRTSVVAVNTVHSIIRVYTTQCNFVWNALHHDWNSLLCSLSTALNIIVS